MLFSYTPVKCDTDTVRPIGDRRYPGSLLYARPAIQRRWTVDEGRACSMNGGRRMRIGGRGREVGIV